MKHFVFSAVQRIWNCDSAAYSTAVSVSRLTARKNWITIKLYTGYLCFDRCKSCTNQLMQTVYGALKPLPFLYFLHACGLMWKQLNENNVLCLNWPCSQFENRGSLRFSEPFATTLLFGSRVCCLLYSFLNNDWHKFFYRYSLATQTTG